MERGTEESSRGPEQGERLFLGYFLQLNTDLALSLNEKIQPSRTFISTCPKGNDSKEEKWGALDESLDFLGQNVHIVASSNGFLLLRILEEHMSFIICNPITKEFRVLPESPKLYRYPSIAFICKGDYEGMSSLVMVNYKIFITGKSNPREMSNVLDLQIFSSETDEWKRSFIESPMPFYVGVGRLLGTMLGEMLYWKSCYHFIAYNCSNERVEVMELPHNESGNHHINRDDVVLSDLLCASNGKLYYVCNFKHRLELWVLQECVGGRADWDLKHSVTHIMMIQHDPNLQKIRSVHFGNLGCIVKSLHPHNPHLVMVFMGVNMYWYDFVAGKLEELKTPFRVKLYASFPYECPLI